MCVCVSIYVCMYVIMYVCMDGWMDGWMDTWVKPSWYGAIEKASHKKVCES